MLVRIVRYRLSIQKPLSDPTQGSIRDRAVKQKKRKEYYVKFDFTAISLTIAVCYT